MPWTTQSKFSVDPALSERVEWFNDPCPPAYVLPCSLLLHNTVTSLLHLSSSPGTSPSPYLSSRPAEHSQGPWACPGCATAHWQPTRQKSKEKEKMASFPPRLRHTEGALAPDLSVNSKVTWRERRKASGIFNHLRLKFFGKQDKGKRIQFPHKWISIKEPDYKKIFKKSSCHPHDSSCVEASSHLPCSKLH